MARENTSHHHRPPCGDLPGLEWSEAHQRYFPVGHVPTHARVCIDQSSSTSSFTSSAGDTRAIIASHPVDPRVLNALDATTLDSGSTECSICVQRIGRNDRCLELPVCGHVFHWDCIMHWLKIRGHCPICRAVVDESLAIAAESASSSAS
uniref:RING-H2 zinc finger protein ATL5 n=1 Tax=Perkinsus marinus TaxID=31276 RepID=C9VXL1_9ALVE|nr:RING-H2 zinc finger protein ATL5 [Perkinsus marinus]